MHRVLASLAALTLAILSPGNAGAAGDGRPDFVPLDVPQLVSRTIDKDTAIASMPVRFGRTARLLTTVTPKAGSKEPPLEAGQPLFGVWMAPPRGQGQVVWCALRPDTKPKALWPWETLCLHQLSDGPDWVLIDSFGMLPLNLDSRTIAARVGPIEIEPGPVDFGHPLVLTYALREFDKQDVDIDLYLSVEGFERWIGQIHLPREADGSALLPLTNGVLRLTQAGTNRRAYTAAWVTEPRAANAP